MNSLLGYPSIGPNALGPSGLGAMGEGEGIVDKARFVWDVSQGTVAKDLEAQKRTMSRNEKDLNAQRVTLRSLKGSRAKEYADETFSKASRVFFSAKADLNSAIADQNDVADKIRTYTIGFADPPSVGMAAIPLIVAAAWVGGFVIAFSALILSAAIAYNVATASGAGVQTVIGESAEAIKAAGGVILNIGNTFMKVALTAGALFVGYEVYRNYKSTNRTATLATTSALKSVDGMVVA